jgi:hypothetical protein
MSNPNLITDRLSGKLIISPHLLSIDVFRRSFFVSLDDMAEALVSIRLSDDKIEIVNQLLLPHTTEWLTIDTIEQAHDAIKTMKVGISRPSLRAHAAAQSRY